MQRVVDWRMIPFRIREVPRYGLSDGVVCLFWWQSYINHRALLQVFRCRTVLFMSPDKAHFFVGEEHPQL